jgi:hypothetical protein
VTVYVVHLQARDDDDIRALRWLLKRALREFQMRCTSIQEFHSTHAARSSGSQHPAADEGHMATKADRFPRKYFRAAELKDRPLTLEIEREEWTELTDPKTGKTSPKSLLSFVGTRTKLVLNGTNWDKLVELCGSSDSKEWPGHRIELYATTTPMGGDIVPCVRIRTPSAPELPLSRQPKPKLAKRPAAPPEPGLDDEIPTL